MLDIHVTGLEPDKKLRALIAGNQGAGKTLFSSTFPNPFIASCEGGMLSLSSRRVPYHEVTHSKQMDEIIQGLKQPADIREKIFGAPVDTLVIDTIDALQRLLKKQYMEDKHQDNFLRNDWGWLGEKMRSYMRAWMGLDVNLVVTSHLGTETDEELGRLFYWPALEGAMKKEIPNSFDICGILNARGTTVVKNGQNHKEIERKLQLFPEPSTPWLKDRSGKLPLEFEVNLEDDYDRLASFVFADWEINKAKADKELAELEAKARANAEEIANLVDPPDKKLIDLPKPTVVETITSDQFQQLTAPFQAIEDSGRRKLVKDEFVAKFGNPMTLPLDRLDEATEWVSDEVNRLSEPIPATPDPEVPSENVEPTLDSTPSDDVPSESQSPSCDECGSEIDDLDAAELSEIQFGVKLCASDFKKKANQ